MSFMNWERIVLLTGIVGALADYQKAAQLFHKQGNQDQYQMVQDSLRQLQ